MNSDALARGPNPTNVSDEERVFVNQTHTGEGSAAVTAEPGICVAVIKLPEAKRDFVLRPRRWVVKHSLVHTWLQSAIIHMESNRRLI